MRYADKNTYSVCVLRMHCAVQCEVHEAHASNAYIQTKKEKLCSVHVMLLIALKILEIVIKIVAHINNDFRMPNVEWYGCKSPQKF